MSLVKHQIECPDCGHTAFVVTEVELDPPKYCPQCASPLDENQSEEAN